MKKRFISAFLLYFVLGHSSNGWAAVEDLASLSVLVESLQGKVSGLETVVDKQSETIEQQNAKIQSLEKTARIRPAPKSGEVPYVALSDEEFKEKFEDGLKEKIGKSDKWLKDLDVKGDFRLRYEAIEHGDESGKANDRNRFRYRARLGMEKKFNPHMKVGVGLASAADGDAPTSTNETFSDNFSFKSVSIEKAYATYKPVWAEAGPVTEVEITGGKFSNPFAKDSSISIWDGDVRPEGFYQKVTVKPIDTNDLDVYVYGLFGQFILSESSSNSDADAELYAFRGLINPQIDIGLAKPVSVKSGFTFYNYSDYSQNPGAANGNPSAVSFGPGLSANDFDIIETYNEIQMQPWAESPVPGLTPVVTTFFDWARNTRADAPTIAGGDLTDAWSWGVKIGKAKKQGSWEALYEYHYIEPNAVVGAFNDSDFGHANRRGSVIRAACALTDNLKAGVSAFFTNNVTPNSGLSGIPAADRRDERQTLIQTDLVWKFG